jgi:hypothetical protein
MEEISILNSTFAEVKFKPDKADFLGKSLTISLRLDPTFDKWVDAEMSLIIGSALMVERLELTEVIANETR